MTDRSRLPDVISAWKNCGRYWTLPLTGLIRPYAQTYLRRDALPREMAEWIEAAVREIECLDNLAAIRSDGARQKTDAIRLSGAALLRRYHSTDSEHTT